MSGRGHVVEWVETTEEVVASEECPPDTDDPSAVLTVTEHADTPIHKLLDTMVQGEDPEDDGFYCVECRALFQGQVEYHGVDGPSFILDSPTAMGSPQRALLTLPHGLMIGRSSIPSAGLGVINQGPTVFPGMHFGPYEGEPATAEVALQSDFSWEISKGKDEYEYIDAARDSHSNWMRYVNCARSEEESNLLAVQYKDSILFHCCRSIQPGDELMVWPSGQLLSRFSHTWAQIWFLKCTQTESNTGAVSQVFLCAQCPLSFTTEAYLQRHTDHVHSQPTQDCTAAPGIEAAAAAPGHPPPVADTDDPQQASLLVLTVDPVESKTCSECGRTFKHVHHLKRHKLSVHSNERPYCCTQCRRCFSQASGLLRHQLVHKKQKMVEKMVKEACTVASRTTHLHETTKESEPTGAEDPAEAESVREETDASPNVPQEETDASPNVPQEETDASPNVPQEETDASPNFPQKETDANLNFPQKETDASPNIPQEETDTSPNVPQEEADENPNSPLQKADSDPNIPRESSDEQSHKCSHCDKIFTCEGSLTKHKRSVHSRIRPYVCTVCLQGFRQYSDLTRHLKTHQKGKGRKRKAGGEPTTFVTVYCDKCLLTFSSDDSLRRHLSQHHPEETSQVAPVDDRERSPLPSLSDGNRDPDPDFIAPPSVAAVAAESTGRPQRLAARSKISAIIKMMAPKRRLSVGKKTEENRGEVEAKPGASTQIDGGVTVAKLGRYGCSRCEGAYRNPADLRAHECAEKRHKCAQCSSTFKTSGFLKRHERMVHSVATPYICERCNRTFGKVCTLKQHQKANRCEKHHCSSELFRCPFCQFSFTLKSYLRKHIKRHHPVEFLSHSESDRLTCELGEEEAGESYNCPHCGKTYVNVKYFKAHMCFKQVRILYLCTDCGKGFANHYGLRQHQRIHTGEKPYSCPHCSKSFSYMGQVNVHIRTHTGEKPYLCTHCGESFRQSGDLKRHERKHTGVRPYSCPEVGCCKSFSRPQSLKAHQLLHLGQRMFKCTQCGKSFSRNYHLRRHHQKMHS